MGMQKLDALNAEQQANARERLERLVAAVRTGRPKTEIARDFGISRTRVYDLIAKAKAQGLL